MDKSLIKVGQRVFWNDPDNGACSGPGVITKVQSDEDDPYIYDDTVISIQKDDGGEAEVYPHEIEKLTP